MKPGLAVGDRARFSRRVTGADSVPRLFPDAGIMADMPDVLATAKMIGLMEWACVAQLLPYYEEGECSLGIHVDVSHVAPTPPGLTVTVDSEVTEIDGRFVSFSVRAHDGTDLIGEGRHRRAVVLTDRFAQKAAAKAAQQEMAE
jgi:fluoroacetyl-CoA thioesterase